MPSQLTTNDREQPAAISSEELERQVAAGDRDAFEKLALHHSPRLLRILQFRHRGDLAQAEDILQETLIKAFQNLHRYDPAYAFRTWLYTIAFRISTDHLRKSPRAKLFTAVDNLDTACQQQPVEISLANRELLQNIWGIAKEVLTEVQYITLWLHIGEQMTIGDVARVMRRGNISTRVTLHRAKSNLLPHISQYSCWEDSDAPLTSQSAPRLEPRQVTT